MRLQAATAYRSNSPSSSSSAPAFDPATIRSDHLIAASRVGTGDRVLVFGYYVLDHLVGLARHRVDTAMGVHAGYPYRPHEPVDVVWFTCVSDIDAEVTRLLGGLGRPRTVAIELMDGVEFGQLRRAIRRLREMGLAHTSYYKAAGRFIVTAWRATPAGTAAAIGDGAVVPMRAPARAADADGR